MFTLYYYYMFYELYCLFQHVSGLLALCFYVRQPLSPLSIHGEAKCALDSLDVAKCLHPKNG